MKGGNVKGRKGRELTRKVKGGNGKGREERGGGIGKGRDERGMEGEDIVMKVCRKRRGRDRQGKGREGIGKGREERGMEGYDIGIYKVCSKSGIPRTLHNW